MEILKRTAILDIDAIVSKREVKLNANGSTTYLVVAYLITRLKRNNAIVRLKALQVIKQTCRRGSPDFRRFLLSSNSGVECIKDCLKWKGVKDPLKGDSDNAKVRAEAKEALEAVFDDSQDQPRTSVLAHRIQGMGHTPQVNNDVSHQSNSSATGGYNSGQHNSTSTRLGTSLSEGIASASSLAHAVTQLAQKKIESYSGGQSKPPGHPSSVSNNFSSGNYSSQNNSNSKYKGIGNPNFADPRNQPKGFIDRVRDRLDKFNDNPNTTQTAQMTSSSSSGSYVNPSYVQRQEYNTTSTPYNTPQRPSGGGTQYNTGRYNNTMNSNVKYESDGAYETSLVENICSSGGVRSYPNKKELDDFCSACGTLNSELIMQLLCEKLLLDDTKTQLKALCVIEALLTKSDNSTSEYNTDSSADMYADFLDSNSEVIERLCQSDKKMIKTKSEKIWFLLYGEENDNVVQEQQEQDLLGFEKEDDLLTDPSPAETTTLFTGLNLNKKHTQQNTNQQDPTLIQTSIEQGDLLTTPPENNLIDQEQNTIQENVVQENMIQENIGGPGGGKKSLFDNMVLKVKDNESESRSADVGTGKNGFSFMADTGNAVSSETANSSNADQFNLESLTAPTQNQTVPPLTPQQQNTIQQNTIAQHSFDFIQPQNSNATQLQQQPGMMQSGGATYVVNNQNRMLNPGYHGSPQPAYNMMPTANGAINYNPNQFYGGAPRSNVMGQPYNTIQQPNLMPGQSHNMGQLGMMGIQSNTIQYNTMNQNTGQHQYSGQSLKNTKSSTKIKKEKVVDKFDDIVKASMAEM